MIHTHTHTRSLSHSVPSLLVHCNISFSVFYSRFAVVALSIHVTQPRPVVAQTTCGRILPPMFAVETLSISSGLSINVAMGITSGFLQAVYVAVHLRGVEWWVRVMPAVGIPLITVEEAKCVSAVHCMIPYLQGSVAVGAL